MCCPAGQAGHIEGALPRIVQNAVAEPVQIIALRHHGVADQFQCLGVDYRFRDLCWIGVHELRVAQPASAQLVCPVLGRSTCKNAIEVLRVSLRLHERLTTPARTTCKIAACNILTIVVLGQRLCSDRRPVHGHVAEIH